ncbi:tRNA (adenosine(37)-N6)-threonylcarbamoyltransferase complex ATPase subunit type 1 TsaE [Candidatus Gottesmanbacteria bacterium RIFCSPHIGHO2_02_FULL_39_14]|uniref:tRNA threonylcarbamoyladenosine biosynthesis protein TsaE n=3 Tax=Candidatus Gottesmaniibacteriota TaxID=1752720 RepID=A0A1F5ZXR0_9BACT|nr:MAG: tRNA (adenosine(37)-N6)-threonylcarbamoyltransferase complex ATPase subunit type 1 TsaE [Candidatus Gottesmanbacteria bacterium RBG_16_38_7b]OGG17231.1 MAG: tRNA (adenosine(37)-N6)-threonylcarbamoyltransferase complex ATPase subunit type 1 TsaE [Candidatus Gottesmanbacteria bacterium RIFCSPHIGHO2_02_FULL_39_14]OGG30896.1 MAG: tRNA (adenosine(37)-N6)-threonylcarbamoyltransferase complex ATPase subunit type 1 TsaE [Candidatus Gottesmanbacteria bacterium RIFCSPLOWO2_02_FULL_38_8]
MPVYITNNQRQTFDLGKKLAPSLQGREVLALYGELGAGKTSLISGIINYFIPSKRVLSPTFIIVRHYYPRNKPVKKIIHADLYRLNKLIEISGLGLTEYFNNPSTVMLIEWADRMKKLLPTKRTDIFFKIKSENTREIKIEFNSLNPLN